MFFPQKNSHITFFPQLVPGRQTPVNMVDYKITNDVSHIYPAQKWKKMLQKLFVQKF